jgi:hypothetical protein
MYVVKELPRKIPNYRYLRRIYFLLVCRPDSAAGTSCVSIGSSGLVGFTNHLVLQPRAEAIAKMI